MLAASNVMVALPQRTDLESHLEEWYAALRASRRSPYTVTFYRAEWDKFIKRCNLTNLDEVTKIRVRAYLGTLDEQGKASGTVHIAFRSIRAFISWCLTEQIPIDPSLLSGHQGRGWFAVTAPTLEQHSPDVLTASQIKSIEGISNDGWHLLFIHTLLSTGLRLGEALALEMEDYIQMDTTMVEGDAMAYFRVRTSKNHRPRHVAISHKLNRDLLRYTRRERKGTSSRLFLMSTGKPVTRSAVKSMFSRLSKQMGFKVHAHQLRHTFATNYLRKRPGEALQLQRAMGWVNQQMLGRYVHLGMDDMVRGWEEKTLY